MSEEIDKDEEITEADDNAQTEECDTNNDEQECDEQCCNDNDTDTDGESEVVDDDDIQSELDQVKAELEKTNNVEAAAKVGTAIAKKALDKGIKTVVFDRGGYIYHGKVQALADAAREAGLEFQEESK